MPYKPRTEMVRIASMTGTKVGNVIFEKLPDGTFTRMGKVEEKGEDGTLWLDSGAGPDLQNEIYVRRQKRRLAGLGEFTRVRRCNIVPGMEVFSREGGTTNFTSLGVFPNCGRLPRGRVFYIRGPMPEIHFKTIVPSDLRLGMELPASLWIILLQVFARLNTMFHHLVSSAKIPEHPEQSG